MSVAGDFFAPPLSPKTKLGRHRQLAPTAGIHVSPICLGAMSIGDKWDQIMGTMDKESSFKLLDAFYDAGGNFIDTANGYQDETSEMFIGEWIESRGIRDQMVIATKYTTNFKRGRSDIKQHTSYVGNSMKSMHISVEQSLKKLRTSYVDILYLHWVSTTTSDSIFLHITFCDLQWDYTTSIEEVMNGLHALVMAGKVLYLGISDTPAWIVASANRYARMSNRTPFSVYQGSWSVLERDFERDIIPMARAEGMALTCWNVLASGRIRSDAQERERLESGEKGRAPQTRSQRWERTDEEKRVAKVLEEVAKAVGAKTIQDVAIAYVMQKTPYAFPMVGGRKVEHLYANISALDVTLTEEHIRKIEEAVPFNKGDPYNRFGDGSDYGFYHRNAGHFDKWPSAPAIRPSY